MRRLPILLVAVGLSLSACDAPVVDSTPGDPSIPEGPSTPAGPATGQLVITTSTQGDDPDRDGYLVTVDDVDSLAL